jgi:hypothetical protein
MKASICARTAGAMVFLGFTSTVPLAMAGAPSTCDAISKDVREAVSKDPSKVLMIVEDALVINESCACEIVKAAIMASNANDSTVQQIVQTALAVAPKMSAIIAECAAAVAPNSGLALAGSKSTEKPDGKNPSPVAPVASASAAGSDFSDAWATNIRGVYLIQPAAAGFITNTETGDPSSGTESGTGSKSQAQTNDDDANDNDDAPVNRANSRRTRNLVALSPAQARP